MNLVFSKMHGLGNDFVVLDATEEAVNLSAEQVRFIADRHFGIGCDQLLIVEPAKTDDTEFYYRIYNADGSEVEQCGNGARCFARFVNRKGLSSNQVLSVGTAKGNITLYLEDNEQVRVNMGPARFRPSDIPLAVQPDVNANAPTDEDTLQVNYTANVAGKPVDFMSVSMGNPHAVLLVDDVDTADVHNLGPELESHPIFPERVNVGFMQIVNRQHIRLRVFERGTGETLACGTGACAAVVCGQNAGLLDQGVTVELPGGQLFIDWQGSDQPVWMTGPATFVFEGNISL